MTRRSTSAALFIAIGLALYAGVYTAAERLMQRTAHGNPFHKIATVGEAPIDWVILGASHAMPLDFADFNAWMERETGLKILNLAADQGGFTCEFTYIPWGCDYYLQHGISVNSQTKPP